MNKECVFLSTACDFNAMYELRNKSRAYGIELTPCKSIYEMLQYAIRGCNAILVQMQVEEIDKFIQYFESPLKNKLFFLEDGSVYDYLKIKRFDNCDVFFKSEVFISNCKRLNTDSNEELITNKLAELGIVMNSWIARYVKFVLIEMRLRECNVVNKELLETVAAMHEITCKYLMDTIRKTIKDYKQKLESKTGEKLEKDTTMFTIEKLYSYIFD